MHLIEFTGLPGSGKDTILPIVVKYLSKKNIKVLDKRQLFSESKEFPQLLKPFISFIHFLPISIRNIFLALFSKIVDNNYNYLAANILDNLPFFENAMKDISESPLTNQQKKLATLWFLNLLHFHQMSIESLSEKACLILNEGYFHKIINLYVHLNKDIDFTKMERYIKSAPPINILIRVNCTIELCAERLSKRSLPKVIQRSSNSELKKYLELSNKAINFSQSLMASKGTKIIEVDNSTPSFSKENIIHQLVNLAEYFKANNIIL